jgi:hypothetical protein
VVDLPLCFDGRRSALHMASRELHEGRVQLGGFGSKTRVSFRLITEGKQSEEYTLLFAVAPGSSANHWSARIAVGGASGAASLLTEGQVLESDKGDRTFLLPATASGQPTSITFDLPEFATLSTPNPFVFTAPLAGRDVTLPFTLHAQSGMAVSLQIHVKVAARKAPAASTATAQQ